MFQRLWVAGEERQGTKQLSLSGRGDGERKQVMQNPALREVRHDQEVCRSQNGRENILSNHHLRSSEACVQLGRGEDMVLSGVGQAIQKEVDGQQEDAPSGGSRLTLGSDFLASSWVMQTESCDTESDHQDNTILVQRVSLAEDGQVQDHDREELA